MAQLQSTSIAAPGFYGLNTQESSITLASGFALEATNCVIDKYGRLGSRQGWIDRTSASTVVNIKGVHEFINNSGVSEYVSWGDNKVYSGLSTLTDITNSASISADNWQSATLSNRTYLFQRGHHPLILESGGSLIRVDAAVGNAGTPPQANTVLSSYGRLWAADITGNNHTIYFSDIVTQGGGGMKWAGGTSGNLDIAKVWTKGGDSIVALAAFNGRLIIFCKNSIVIYDDKGAGDNYLTPSDLRLVDVIEGVGCMARDSVQNTGTDILFLSNSGIRSLGRIIQEKSAPLGELSINVRDELTALAESEPVDNIKSVYSPKHAFYLISFPSSEQAYCFDTRGKLENGAARTTRWADFKHKGMVNTSDNKLLFGQTAGIAEYSGYSDNGVTYRMFYYTNYFDFDQPTTVKILKSVGITLIGGSGQVFTIKSGIDYSDEYRSYNATVKQTALSEYGIDEAPYSEYGPSPLNEDGDPYTPYTVTWDGGSGTSVAGTAEYTGGGGTDRVKLSIGGSGTVIQLGFETEISGNEVSIQKFDLYIKIGRVI